MSIQDENKNKRRLVALAWENEKTQILDGLGTQDWSQAAQENILGNKFWGFVGQWTFDFAQITEKDVSKVQLVRFYIDYLWAHSGTFRTRTFGYVDTTLDTIRPNSYVKTVVLSNPAFLGQQAQKAVSQVGQINQFGIKIGAAKIGDGNNKMSNKEIRKREYGF